MYFCTLLFSSKQSTVELCTHSHKVMKIPSIIDETFLDCFSFRTKMFPHVFSTSGLTFLHS